MLKRILRGHGLCGPVRDDLAVVETSGEFLETQAIAAEMAFEALVERHGSMVLRACRSILRDEHEVISV